jgi:phage terminase small subunit
MTAPAPRKIRRPGKLNTLPEALPVVDGTEWGPAMAALPSDRHRAFVLALYSIKPGHGAHVKAAKMAGFGSATSSAHSWAVIGSRLSHDEKILAAIHEEDQRRIRSSAPRAIRALQNLVETPDHRDHARAIGMVLDRVHPAEQHHVHEMHVTSDHTAEAIEELRVLKGLGVSREKLEEMFGYSGLSRYERLLAEKEQQPGKLIAGGGPVIEGTAVEVTE